MYTGGAYLPLRHDRHFNEASSFQIGVSQGRLTASRGMLALAQLGRLERPIGEFCEAPLRKSESDQRRADGGRRQNACSVDLLPCR